MDNEDKGTIKPRASRLGGGMGLGLVFGGLFGLIVDNMVLFAGGGMILGLAIATAIENRRTRV